MMSMSPGDRSSRRMFSTRPSGVRPAPKSTRVSRPSFVTVTNAENPCSARRASSVVPPARSGAGIRGEAAIEGRLAGPWSGRSESVTLSTRVVTVSASTGSSAIASTFAPVYRNDASGASRGRKRSATETSPRTGRVLIPLGRYFPLQVELERLGIKDVDVVGVPLGLEFGLALLLTDPLEGEGLLLRHAGANVRVELAVFRLLFGGLLVLLRALPDDRVIGGQRDGIPALVPRLDGNARELVRPGDRLDLHGGAVLGQRRVVVPDAVGGRVRELLRLLLAYLPNRACIDGEGLFVGAHHRPVRLASLQGS